MATENAARAAHDAGQQNDVAAHGTRRVLVVEDDETLRGLIVERLQRSGHHVESVGDGESALAFVAREPVDLVCLDLSLPLMTGFRVCEALRQSDRARGVAILVVSARTTIQDHTFALEMGADAFLEKPFKRKALEREVARLLDVRAARMPTR